ncbi:MAG: hypothetical protein WD738_10675 [Pirellulales bacterium]
MNRTSTIVKYLISASTFLMVVFSAVAALADRPSTATNPAVQRASFDRASRELQKTVQFGRRVACAGDQVEQSISLEMRLATSLRQGNELVERNQTLVRSPQRRVVTTTEVDGDRITAVQVRYFEATKQITVGEAPEPVPPAAQPVQGKTYHCRRTPGDDGKLNITDAEGQIPPPEEFEIVAQNMEMVGRSNPLVKFLSGRTVAIGETLQLPQDFADQLFNLGKRFGHVTRFDLVLENVETHDGVPCAVFTARVEAASSDSSQMRMQVEGPLVMQIDTCRAVRLALSGPIGMSETRGSYSTAYQLIGTGQLKTSIASKYRDAKR